MSAMAWCSNASSALRQRQRLTFWRADDRDASGKDTAFLRLVDLAGDSDAVLRSFLQDDIAGHVVRRVRRLSGRLRARGRGRGGVRIDARAFPSFGGFSSLVSFPTIYSSKLVSRRHLDASRQY